MADEQAQAETTAPEIQEETTETTEETSTPDESVSEDAKNTSEELDKPQGDLRVALQEERRKRQEYERLLKDPQFVYEQARTLGLTEEEAQEQADAVANQTVNQPDISVLVKKEVASIRDYEKALEMMPEIEKDPNLSTWAAGLVDTGYTHTQAVKIIQDTLSQATQSASTKGRQEARQEISDKERAQTATQTSPVNSETLDDEDLQKRMKSYDKKTQEAAFVEWIMKKNK